MFSKQFNTIVAVHGDEAYWFSGGPDNNARQFFQMPLQQLLNDETALSLLPDWLRGSQNTLCIIPDHWFGSQSYPFQSGKASLIEPFLERKLLAARPGQTMIRHFFGYRQTGDGGRHELSVFYFQEEKSYQLYSALRKLNHSCQQITAPAFLWEDILGQAIAEFRRLGTLLVHLTGQECQLYFYYQGLYQFSRSIVVADGDDGFDTLGYEINQSLYLFSQTAKNELDRIYIRCDTRQYREKLSEVLGREVIDVEPLMGSDSSEILVIPQLAILNGWLRRSQLHSGARFFSIIHRQVKQALEWRPVQWAGTLIGLVLLLGLMGEHFVLRTMHTRAEEEYRGMQQRTRIASSSEGLSEYPVTLDHVLKRARHSMLVDKAYRLPDIFPDRVMLIKLELMADSELPPTLKVAALVQARNADELQEVLQRLTTELKGRFQGAQNLTLNDFDIRLNSSGAGPVFNSYQIDFTLELT